MMDIRFNPKTGAWEEARKPFALIKCYTKEDYHALEKYVKKQHPQKVRFEDIGYDIRGNANVYSAICPSCGLNIVTWTDDDLPDNCSGDTSSPEEMWHDNFVHHEYIGRNSYCNRCGQKLDWGDKNDRR